MVDDPQASRAVAIRQISSEGQSGMLKEPTPKRIDGSTLSEEVYRLAIERIEALAGCTEDSCEERELIDWATIANTYEQSTACARGETQAVVP
jgi:hypothetical protein